MEAGSRITFKTEPDGGIVRVAHLDHPMTINSALSGWRNVGLLDDLARAAGLDADEQTVAPHRKGRDLENLLLVGWSAGHGTVEEVEPMLFVRCGTLTLVAGKTTGPNSCTYVGTDERVLSYELVSDYRR